LGLLALDKDAHAKIELLDAEDEKFSVDFNRFYLHFPWVYYEVYGLGSNEGGRLGMKDVKAVLEPRPVPNVGKNKIVAILSAAGHSFVTLLHHQ
jgi:hypothetical protein